MDATGGWRVGEEGGETGRKGGKKEGRKEGSKARGMVYVPQRGGRRTRGAKFGGEEWSASFDGREDRRQGIGRDGGIRGGEGGGVERGDGRG